MKCSIIMLFTVLNHAFIFCDFPPCWFVHHDNTDEIRNMTPGFIPVPIFLSWYTWLSCSNLKKANLILIFKMVNRIFLRIRFPGVNNWWKYTNLKKRPWLFCLKNLFCSLLHPNWKMATIWNYSMNININVIKKHAKMLYYLRPLCFHKMNIKINFCLVSRISAGLLFF